MFEPAIFRRSKLCKAWLRLAGDIQMKRKAAWVAILSAVVLLSGCWPYWHDGRHHRHYYDEDRGGHEYRRY
ncbi:hypothetical protein EI693_13625 [Pseudomonas oryziphila]|uniref:Lipoprotein n=1 Tax=Pseudomonas oryziphila TaxID=2894079 RepID=A0ABN5TIZ3_9PSED|nr:hypothetical protein EI693_13625 [Pseudomonas oryziphila]